MITLSSGVLPHQFSFWKWVQITCIVHCETVSRRFWYLLNYPFCFHICRKEDTRETFGRLQDFGKMASFHTPSTARCVSFKNLPTYLSLPNVKYKRTDALSLWHEQQSTTVDIHEPLQTRGETRCPGGVSVPCFASRTRHKCPRHNESEYMEAWHWM